MRKREVSARPPLKSSMEMRDHLWLTEKDNTSLKILTNDFICCLKQQINKQIKAFGALEI